MDLILWYDRLINNDAISILPSYDFLENSTSFLYLSFSFWKGKLLLFLKSEKMYFIEREKKIQIHNVLVA